MRGSRLCACVQAISLGIIPAHAGLTARKSRRFTIRRDHPRACGAHLNTPAFAWLFQGSSPRMRGSHRGKDKSLVRAGIIPAHAGLTRLQQSLRQFARDHPRACGAHLPALPFTTRLKGSSPRMRGSLHCLLSSKRGLRIIPAHAGLTRISSTITWPIRDHPRACGAHLILSA